MAKKKKRTIKVPALSATDKVIYYCLCAVSFLSGLFFSPIVFALYQVFSQDPHILAQDHLGFGLLFVFGFFLCTMLAKTFDSLRRRKQPIFGKKGIKYGPPQWKPVYPFFSCRFWECFLSDKKRVIKVLTVSLLSALIITGVTALILPIRECLYDTGSVASFNCLNECTKEYTISDFEKVRIYTIKNYSRNGSSWSIEMELTMHDGEDFFFTAKDFYATDDNIHGAITGMLKIKSQVNPEIIVLEGEGAIPYVIRDMALNQQETELLYSLFEQKN